MLHVPSSTRLTAALANLCQAKTPPAAISQALANIVKARADLTPDEHAYIFSLLRTYRKIPGMPLQYKKAVQPIALHFFASLEPVLRTALTDMSPDAIDVLLAGCNTFNIHPSPATMKILSAVIERRMDQFNNHTLSCVVMNLAQIGHIPAKTIRESLLARARTMANAEYDVGNNAVLVRLYRAAALQDAVNVTETGTQLTSSRKMAALFNHYAAHLPEGTGFSKDLTQQSHLARLWFRHESHAHNQGFCTVSTISRLERTIMTALQAAPEIHITPDAQNMPALRKTVDIAFNLHGRPVLIEVDGSPHFKRISNRNAYIYDGHTLFMSALIHKLYPAHLLLRIPAPSHTQVKAIEGHANLTSALTQTLSDIAHNHIAGSPPQIITLQRGGRFACTPLRQHLS